MLRNNNSRTLCGSRSISALTLALGICAHADTIQRDSICIDCTPPPAVQRLSVCKDGGGDIKTSLSCPDPGHTWKPVLGPHGHTINQDGFPGISDEHQTIFAPNKLDGSNPKYMFFVATRSEDAWDTGLVVLEATAPDPTGQWTLLPANGYGWHSALNSFGQEFMAPVPHNACPKVSSASKQDPTFDLNYAAPGSVVLDPTNPGSLLMVYEGANTCVGFDIGPGTNPQQGGVYITTGVATSIDYGKNWPIYRSDFLYPPGLPGQNSLTGPQAPLGAFGAGVCMGLIEGDNPCANPAPPAGYGRYPVLSPVFGLSSIMKAGRQLLSNMADAQPAAFVDDAVKAQYMYVMHDDTPGQDPWAVWNNMFLTLSFPDGRVSDLGIARARLNGGTAPLSFDKWDGKAYAARGMGGKGAQFLPDGNFSNCADVSQGRFSGSISFVEETGQYLLLFVCISPGEPLPGSGPGGAKGAAWFWATSTDLSNPALWSAPQPVAGSWSLFEPGGVYNGWYPSLMSMKTASGHLSTANDSYVFSMYGSQGSDGDADGIAAGRTYLSRRLTIVAK